ncbi:unnamed protein product [Chondrus crispus]|uniref:Transmembrane protein n=1 Tax=Chondrus crispus TaxID=2769 RepID=R7Q7N0_CHOCR|nr:unnamed protein product [Chondrus crispus]CDF33396.1 unnamed protein product [Chondrus crispus]|eukprot:XP_005713199.1 unnamed protein product [Chondrus crispus]
MRVSRFVSSCRLFKTRTPLYSYLCVSIFNTFLFFSFFFWLALSLLPCPPYFHLRLVLPKRVARILANKRSNPLHAASFRSTLYSTPLRLPNVYICESRTRRKSRHDVVMPLISLGSFRDCTSLIKTVLALMVSR